MAFPLNAHSASSNGGVQRQGRSPQCRNASVVQGGDTAGDHQLEKLEFALAVALTRGDQQRSADLRRQIDALGGNCEEPGT
ncbi:MAG: hypothetical protein ACO23C_09920 [Prochlorococcaceae cyanobacterium]|jgi:hypothetical protein